MPDPLVLVADDQQEVLASLRLLLKSEGLGCRTVRSPAAAIEAARFCTFDAALLDLNYARDTTSGAEGLDLLSALRRLDDTMPLVVMTAWGSIDLAVEAIRRGAADFIEKPWEDARLVSILLAQIKLSKVLRRSRRLHAENALLRGSPPDSIVAESGIMREVLSYADQIAGADATILITGENGTGKGVLARYIHTSSRRSEQPFIRVNLGGLAESLFESELFGHVKGAFTDAKEDRIGRFELADGGTLFLDEIGNISPEQQARLLYVLEEGEFERVGSSRPIRTDVRIIAATNADLVDAMAEGRFRKDLYYRLNTIKINLPPLRNRPEDIAPLAVRFLAEYSEHYGKALGPPDHQILVALRNYKWPGNVRELQHVIERAVLVAQGDRVQLSDLHLEDARPRPSSANFEEMPLDDVEKHLISSALDRHHGNVQRAADALG